MKKQGFTLIELLIVVAIIAILAAIAIPNFLQAQTRAKISRVRADMRSMATAIESYYVDHNIYPEERGYTGMLSQSGVAGVFRLTTPISYLSSIPESPFNEYFGHPNLDGLRRATSLADRNIYLFVSKHRIPNFTENIAAGGEYFVHLDAQHYMPNVGVSNVMWLLKSVGPDNHDTMMDFHQGTDIGVLYDPTNGTISRGDLGLFGPGFSTPN